MKNQRLDIVYFNLYSNSFSKLYKINNEYTVSGKVEIFKGIPQITILITLFLKN